MRLWSHKIDQAELDDRAKRIVALGDYVLTSHENLEPALAADFPHVNRAWYDATEQALVAAGVHVVGDYHGGSKTSVPPERRSFYRFGLTPAGDAVVMWFDVIAPPAAKPVPPVICCISHLEDGRVVSTGQGGVSSLFPVPPDFLEEDLAIPREPAKLLERHRERLALIRGRPRTLANAGDIIAAHNERAERRRAYRIGLGLEFYERVLRTKFKDDFDKEGAPLLDTIRRHPEWSRLHPSHREAAMTEAPNAPAAPLPVPADILATGSFEIARVWSGGGKGTYIIDVKRFADKPEVFGMIAVDLMKHAARAYEQFDGRSHEDAYKRILMGLMAEMENPTEPD